MICLEGRPGGYSILIGFWRTTPTSWIIFNRNQHQRYRSKGIKDSPPRQPYQHGNKKTFIYKVLETASHVFVRREPTKATFDPFYKDQFCVISRSIRIAYHASEIIVAMNVVNPVYTITEEHQPQANVRCEQQPTTRAFHQRI